MMALMDTFVYYTSNRRIICRVELEEGGSVEDALIEGDLLGPYSPDFCSIMQLPFNPAAPIHPGCAATDYIVAEDLCSVERRSYLDLQISETELPLLDDYDRGVTVTVQKKDKDGADETGADHFSFEISGGVLDGSPFGLSVNKYLVDGSFQFFVQPGPELPSPQTITVTAKLDDLTPAVGEIRFVLPPGY
jgi:hypothetical protein